MYLKSLTIRGFKSFASATTLQFEPGITCVVGPNGSGKSNVVDALSWVMGEQGAKTLRGGKMDDVIFAGTSNRSPLGRAEVSLTIDNTDGALPIEYTEVTISRTLFRGGGSEYSINGNPSRLLDIQELLSDSGIGREMHVIVGQGQLGDVLQATPEERRGYIEEAAGVLKHRKRKEKALRKLEATDANLVRLQDLTNEIRRQLKPLGRQAELARKAQVFQADARDARLRLLADDLLVIKSALDKEIADETILRQRQQEVEQALAQALNEITKLESAGIEAAPQISRAQEAWFTLSALRERYIGLKQVVTERIRLTSEPVDEQPRGTDPELLDEQAKSARTEEFSLSQESESLKLELANLSAVRAELESKLNAAESSFTAAMRSAADRREGLAQLGGQVAAAQSRRETRETEIGRLTGQVADARRRAADAEASFRKEEAEIAGLDAGEMQLDSHYEEVSATLNKAEAKVRQLQAAVHEAEKIKAAKSATADAISAALGAENDGAAELIAANTPGLTGRLATNLIIETGYETAIAVALGAAADALAGNNVDAATAALQSLKTNKGGRAAIVVPVTKSNEQLAAPSPSRSASSLVQVSGELKSAINSLLADVVVADTLDQARSIHQSNPNLRVVTKDGDLLSNGLIIGGGSSNRSRIENLASAETARQERDAASHELERIKFELESAVAAAQSAADEVKAALSKLHESDAAQAAVALRLAELSQQSRAAAAEAERLSKALADAEVARGDDEQALVDLQKRLANAQSTGSDESIPTSQQRDELLVSVERARAKEVEGRLTLRTAEERHRVATSKAEELERSASLERSARTRDALRRKRRVREGEVAAAVSTAIDLVLERLEVSLITGSTLKSDLEQARAERETKLQALRVKSRELESQRSVLVDSVHRDELARTEQKAKIEAIEDKAMSDFGIDAEVLINEYGPDVLVPPSIPTPGDEVDPNQEPPAPAAYVRVEQEKRARDAERQLNLLGRINPLALEEFTAMEERNRFLGEQLEDVKRTRADLLEVIKEVDQRVQQVFAEAFADTSREFSKVFARLFPGGEGRLILLDPDNLLISGVDVEARPPGKKIKRLSLLSGGERSLVAVAFLVALFKARPSPFYVLDEVEAALDDTNLGRLLEIYEELRENSQLIVITHQKRTMEVADALYGVSMRGDGVSAVISQRIRDVQTELVDVQK